MRKPQFKKEIMNQKEEMVTVSIIETSKKVCSRAKEHTSRHLTEVSDRKLGEHSGIKFKADSKKKVTIPKPFSFDTGPKIKKVIPSTSPEKSPGKQKIQKSEGTHSKITIEASRISKETISSSSKKRSTVIEETHKYSKNDNSQGKKTSSSSRVAKPQIEISKTVSSPVATIKGLKSQSHSLPNSPKSQRKCLKSAMSPAHSTTTVKSQVHFFKAEKSEVKVSCAKGCEFSGVEKSKCEISKDIKHELDASDLRAKKTPSDTSNVKVIDPKLSDASKTQPGCDNQKAENFECRPLNGANHESDSSNETDNGINLECEDSGTKDCETGIPKKGSKIPRKSYGAHSGLKFPANFKKETVPQPFGFENSCSNFKKENIQREANQVKITQMVNN